METTTEQNHAYQNAQGWAGIIAELVAALDCDYERLEELRDERESLSADVVDADATEAGELEKAEAALAEWDEENGEELRELTEAATLEGDLQTDADAVRERIQEGPLSVEVRSGWCSPGSEDYAKPEEFNILLSTGGPALRIRGELDEHGTPSRAWLEYQDWGTPWTEYHGEGLDRDALLTYCQQFYFGE